MQELIKSHILPKLGNAMLNRLTDGAVLGPVTGDLVFTSDAFVVTPLEFPGGDIGRLAVCGTVNDLAMMGARPVALSLAMVIEEGTPLDLLDRILDSVAQAAAEAGTCIATGDTKVVERRGGGGMILTTAGVGERLAEARLDTKRIRAGDCLIVNGCIAEHGLAIMAVREGFEFETELRSDAAPLNNLVEMVLSCGYDVKFLRDPTRGGLATVLADLADDTGLSVEITESALPITAVARHAAELLGLDPLGVANEGKCLMCVSAADADKMLAALRKHPLGAEAAIIGRITDARPPLVEMVTVVGGRRVVQRPYGEELPRIC
ncbi:MAG: hydrogenase expression/formation protein HypE [Phycisphaerae bacterium]|nr:hydrogenase expression/formation protein HypE [Phycisphaerae bacterium]